MNVSDLLNPLENIDITHSSQSRRSRCVSTPVLSPYSHKAPPTKRVQEQRADAVQLVNYGYHYQHSQSSHQQQQDPQQQQQLHHHHQSIGKPRSRFSEAEDNIICDGVAQGLTWGQISELLPHRKRATCFNRYRTLQGIRKSRKNSTSLESNNNSSNDYYSGPVTPPLVPLNTANTNAPPPLVSPPTKYNCYPPSSPFDAIYSKKNYQMTSPPPVHHSQQDPYPSEISSCSSESSSDEELYYHQHHPRPHRVSLPAISCPPLKHL